MFCDKSIEKVDVEIKKKLLIIFINIFFGKLYLFNCFIKDAIRVNLIFINLINKLILFSIKSKYFVY